MLGRFALSLSLALALGACTSGVRSVPGGVGEACRAPGDCEEGLNCEVAWYTNGGVCTRPCAAGECPDGSRCVGIGVFGDDGAPLYRCMSACEREVGTRGGCALGLACHDDGVCRVGCGGMAECIVGLVCERPSGRCLSGGEGEPGSACTTAGDCRGPIAACEAGVCVRFDCDLGDAYACDGEQTCTSVADPVGESSVFVCR